MPKRSPDAPPTRGRTGDGSAIAIAVAVMNVATYGYTIVAARALGPQQYGAFAAVMNVLLVVSVASLALQATAARRIAAAPHHASVVEDGVRRITWRSALLLGGALVLAAPLLDRLLVLESLPTAVLIGVVAVPLTLTGGLAGTLQGERRWRPLALLYLASGLPRIVVGSALIWWRPEEFWAVVGVVVGAVAPVVVGFVALRDRAHRDPAGPPVADDDAAHAGRSVVREALRNSGALLAFFALTNIDVVVARNVLSEHDAGLYAAGLILTKAVLFLPQFVVVLAFPDLAGVEQRRRALRLSLGLVAAAGVVGVAASWLLSGLALVFVGGPAYTDVEDRLWLFALLGTVTSMIQLLVYAVLAREGARAGMVLGVALPVLVLAAATADTLTGLLLVVVVVDVVALAVLALLTSGSTPTRSFAGTGAG